jgi:thiamine-phosphate pyrophosphorylase
MTRLIVISSEVNVTNESELVTSLFTEGMELLHLRKPGWSLAQQRSFLNAIPAQFHRMISVHQHHETLSEFDLKYCHVRSAERMDFARTDDDIVYSTSIHSVEEQYLIRKFNYCFLSPVFDSISKSGYTSRFANGKFVFEMPVYALGGINETNVENALKLGFSGVATLGYIWADPKKAIINFKKLERKCKENVPMY